MGRCSWNFSQKYPLGGKLREKKVENHTSLNIKETSTNFNRNISFFLVFFSCLCMVYYIPYTDAKTEAWRYLLLVTLPISGAQTELKVAVMALSEFVDSEMLLIKNNTKCEMPRSR